MAKRVMDQGTLELPKIDYQELQITINGMTPLIHNKFPAASKKALFDKKTHKASSSGTGKNKVRTAADPERECEERTHFTPKGRYGFPLFALNKCLVSTGQRNGVADAVQLRAAMRVINPNPRNGDMLELKNSGMTRREDIVKLATGVPDICWRPQFDEWSLTFGVRYNAAKISHEQIIQLVRMAGLETGLGAWRPENRNGWAGTFEIPAQGGIKGITKPRMKKAA